ncbi:MAG: UrcA family protein [Caulobacteraceae bacterium]|nr:UrcA family protein [Caulobacteraceae bacterium]
MVTIRNTRIQLGRLGLAAAASLALSAAPIWAQAQQAYDQGYAGPSGGYPDEMSGVTVYAPRYVGRSATTGAPIELVRASRVVDYSDIDPDTEWGAHVLRTRIERAARSACDELDAEYPISTSDNPPCVDEAVRNAMHQVHEDADDSDW